MKILITGGAGFIGSNLSRHLLQLGEFEITIIDDLSNGRLSNLAGLDVDFREASILDTRALSDAMDGADSVVHLGALGSVPRSIAAPLASHAANASGTLNVLEAARQANVEQVIVASSSSVYGANTAIPKSEWDWTRPMSPYAVTKEATEGYTLAYNYAYGTKNLAFRFFNVYGPNQPADHIYAAVIPRFIDAALSGKALTVHGDGFQSRDFTYVDSVCATLTTAIVEGTTSNDPVNLAFGGSTSLLELIAIIEHEVGSSLTVEHVPARTGDVRASQSDGARILELFPMIEPVPLVEGIRRTVAWFKENSGKHG